jgi:hypothetical protein
MDYQLHAKNTEKVTSLWGQRRFRTLHGLRTRLCTSLHNMHNEIDHYAGLKPFWHNELCSKIARKGFLGA